MTPGVPIKLLILDIDGVITDGRVAWTAQGEEQKTVSFRDVDAVFAARRQGLKIALVTGEATGWVDFIARRLEVEHVVRGAKDKLTAVKSLADDLNVGLEEVCFVGDSGRDAPALAAVGLGLAPADASREARQAAARVLRNRGGRGAVAEAVQLVLSRNSPGERSSDGSPTREGASEDDQLEVIRTIAAESAAVQRMVAERLAPEIARAADLMTRTFAGGGQVLAFGNGGSAADADHLAAELIGRFEKYRDGLAAVSLTANTAVLTALGTDFGQDEIFARQIRALARPGDIAVAISTSGRSANVVEGSKAARSMDLPVISLTGEGGGDLAPLSDVFLAVPSRTLARIQEAHRLIIHTLCALVEQRTQNNA